LVELRADWDGNSCTDDKCYPATGVLKKKLIVLIGCCTEDDCCELTGSFHYPVNCYDNDPCTVDDCNEYDGCFHKDYDCNDTVLVRPKSVYLTLDGFLL